MSVQFTEDNIEIDDEDDVLQPLIHHNRRDHNEKGTTWYAAIFLVVNAALGAGLLNFPEAFNLAGGLTVAISVQAVLLVFVIIALLIMASCANINDSSTYQDVVLGTCGKTFQKLCAVGICLYCYGTCITFLVIIGDQFDRMLASLYGHTFCHYWYMNRHFTITITSILFILPISFSRRIDFLKYASSVGVFAILYVVFLIIYEFYDLDYHPVDIKTRPDQWTDVFNVVPTICFGYQCHVSAIPIYSCLKKRTVSNFSKTIFAAILICMVVYTLAGSYGYLTFGSKVPSDVLEYYNAQKPIVLIGIVMLTIKTITTYPILLFCGRVAIDGLITNCISQSVAIRSENLRRILISSIWFITTLFITAFVPDISPVIDILGSLAAIFIFVFPGLSWMTATLTKDTNLVLLKDKLIIIVSCIFIVIGVFLFGVVLCQAIVNLVNGSQIPIQLCY